MNIIKNSEIFCFLKMNTEKSKLYEKNSSGPKMEPCGTQKSGATKEEQQNF